MIPDPLGVLQRAELPERRVARGGLWCRRVEVLQQVLPTLRLTKSLRRARRESSRSCSPSTPSPSSSPSSFGGFPRGTSEPLGPLLESHGALEAAGLAMPSPLDTVTALMERGPNGVPCARLDGDYDVLVGAVMSMDMVMRRRAVSAVLTAFPAEDMEVATDAMIAVDGTGASSGATPCT